MKEKNLFYQPASWIVFVLLAVGGIFYIYHNFDKANSIITVDVQMDREAALEKAAEFAREFQIGPEEFEQAAAFRNDSRFQNFVELEGGGIDTFTQIISKGIYSSYHWSVRHFKEQDANEAVFWFKPNGETYGFYEKIPESDKGAALPAEEARKTAEHYAIYNWDVDLESYELVEQSKEEQISGRVDHTFVYERKDKTVGEGKFRLKLILSGEKLTSVEYTVKIPEDFDRRYSEMRSANDTIALVATAVIAILYGLLGVILGIFILLRKRQLVWKPAVYWGIGIALASVFLTTLNSLPFSWFGYDTSTSESNFLLRQILSGFMGALGFGSVVAVSLMAAEGLGRMAFPGHIRWWRIWSKNTAGSLPVLGQTVAGYLFAIVILSIDVLFYVTTTTHFGWWSPADTLSDPNILANYFPWFDPIAISLQAGFWEESLFRALPIAGVFILTKNKKSRNFWIVAVLILQTLIFGSAHANYAQQPPYARILEMIVPFTIMGIIYIYYGILPAVIAHFSVDVFWISLPLWASSSSGIWLDRILVLLFLFLPLLIVLFFRLKHGKWKKIPETERNGSWQEPEKEEKTEQPERVVTVKKLNTEKWILPLGVVGLILWISFTPFKTDSPILELPKEKAIKIAQTELTKRYNIDFENWTILSSINDQVDIRDIFVWREGGEDVFKNMLSSFLAPPHWNIRLVKTEGKAEEKTEEYAVEIHNNGKILGVSHKIPEKRPGANLTQSEAQHLADSTLTAFFGLKREKLKEVSVSPQKQENRTDWEFEYADTVNFAMNEGQGRYFVEISGDEVTDAYSYVHVPEKWVRSFKDEESRQSVIRTIGNVLVIGTIILGVILGIVRWTRKKFKFKVFIIATSVFAILYLLNVWMNFDSMLAAYTTQVPLNNFITTLLVSIVISSIFFSLFNGIYLAATSGWLPVYDKHPKLNILYSVALGFFIAGALTAVQHIVPHSEPSWFNYSYLNGLLPWLGIAASRSVNIIFYPAFAAVLFLGIHYQTKAWTTQKWVGILYSVLAGLAIMALSFQGFIPWLVSGILIAFALFAVYHFFIRFHFEWIPLSFGLLPLIKTIKEMIIVKNTQLIFGGILMILISSAILYWWYRLLLKNSGNKINVTGKEI